MICIYNNTLAYMYAIVYTRKYREIQFVITKNESRDLWGENHLMLI